MLPASKRQQPPTSKPTGIISLGWTLRTAFLLPKSIRELEEAVRLDPQFALAYWHLAGGYEAMGDLRKVRELWPKIKQLQSRLPRQKLVGVPGAERRPWPETPRTGRSFWNHCSRSFPVRTTPAHSLAQSLISSGETDRAISVLKDGLQLDPRNEIFLNQLGYAQAAKGKSGGGAPSQRSIHCPSPCRSESLGHAWRHLL